MFFQECSAYIWASQVAPWVQETQEMQVRSWVGKIPWRRAWQPTPIFLPGESHGQRSLTAGIHSAAESDMTEATGHTGTHCLYLTDLTCCHAPRAESVCPTCQHSPGLTGT